jgi:hypothetical protein
MKAVAFSHPSYGQVRTSLAVVALIGVCLLPIAFCLAGTIVGPPDDVTGVNDLQISYGGTTYIYDVSFVSGEVETYNQLYASSSPTFYGDFRSAQLAATALARQFQLAGVTNVAGATPLPISPGGPVQEEIFTPYGAGPGADASGGYVAEETDFISNRKPAWIPVGPGCCGGTDDIASNPAAFAVYKLVSTTAPEIDSASVGSALALLVSALAIARRRGAV